MRRVAFLVVLLLVLAACSPQEEALRGLRSCGELEAEDDFGNTRELEGADVVLFSRPGRYTPDEAATLTGLGGEVRHVSRVIGPCGQQDLFLSLDDGRWCASVVGRSWDGSACWDGLEAPALIPISPSDPFGGEANLVWAPGTDPSHAVAATSGGLTVGALLRDGVALLVLPDVGEVEVVGYDGRRTAADGP